MSNLNNSQKSAVEYAGGPLLIVAGAGTGKTTVISSKTAYLLENKLAKPEEILALAFNEKAAQEIIDRVDQQLELGYAELQISTFHAFCQRLLENHGLDIGLGQFKLADDTDLWLMMRRNLEKFGLDYYRPLGNPSRHIHELIRHFHKCKDELILPQAYLEYAQNCALDKDSDDEKNRLSEIANAYHVYNQLLLQNNLLDFGDLIFYAVKLLRERPKILSALQKKYKYILVDEFQDVNWAQYQLVRLLAGDACQLTVVGDDDQSIYAFRGASVSNILRFKKDYPQAKEIVLTENYRSGQQILDIAHKSIQANNPDRLEIKLNLNKKLTAATGARGAVCHSHFHTGDEESRWVAGEIAKIKSADSCATWECFAILIRANSFAANFCTALENANIPYEFLSASGLYKQPIVIDSVNFFRLLDNFHESSAIHRLLCLPFLNFNERDLQALALFSRKKSISFYESLGRCAEAAVSESGKKIAGQILSLLAEGARQAKDKKPTAVLYDFLEHSGYLVYLTHAEKEANMEAVGQIFQLKQFFDYLEKFETATPGAKVADFLVHFNDVLQSGNEGALSPIADTPDSVNILTVHRAKGLEFKYVFIVNLTEDRFPSRRKGEGIEIPLALINEQLPEGDSHFQEERRLFYVAMTRAKERLYFTSASDYGGAREKKLSRFLDELGYKVSSPAEKNKKNPAIEKKMQLTACAPNTLPTSNFFSFSQIKSYLVCPYQYKLGNIYKLPARQSHYFSFGNSIHNTLQEFYRRVQQMNETEQASLFSPAKNIKEIQAPPLKELLEIFDAKWQDDWYESASQKKSYRERGREMLTRFYEFNKTNWTIPKFLEGDFKFKIIDFIMCGRIDRIDPLPDGGLEIIDYKTGEPKDKAQGDDKEQLLLYHMAVSGIGQYQESGAPRRLSLYYLQGEAPVVFNAEDKDLEKLKTKIVDTVAKIRAGKFVPTPEKFTCKNCHYREICEYRG